MRILVPLIGLLFIAACSPKADIDGYVKKSCECIEQITVEKEDQAAVAKAIYDCADYANNQEVYGDLIEQCMAEHPESSYVEAEKQGPTVIENKLQETCPAYRKLIGE